MRIEVRENTAPAGLLVCGPGPERHFIPCHDAWSLIQSLIDQEWLLLAQGYALESGAERRRRRQWEPEPATVKILSRRERSRG